MYFTVVLQEKCNKNHHVPLTLLDDDFRKWLFGNTPEAD